MRGPAPASTHLKGCCPFAVNARAAGLELESWFRSSEMLDGTIFTSAGHSLGDRQVNMDWMTSPWTSVRRRLMPLW